MQIDNETHQLIKSVSIEALLARRDAAVEKLNQAFELIEESRSLTSGMLGSIDFEVRGTYGEYHGKIGVNADLQAFVRDQLDRGGWNYLMNESGLMTFMDEKARSAWRAKLSEQYRGYVRKGQSESDKPIPELTAENIAATFRAQYENRAEMFERGVLNIFKSLSWDYKTNCPAAFGKRIVMRGFMTYGSPDYKANDRLDDLERVFAILDDKLPPDSREGCGPAAWDSYKDGKKSFDRTYFSVKWFKNGNAHVTFLRADLVEKMNCILAKHYPDALPAKSGK